jgi:hypothetical protein
MKIHTCKTHKKQVLQNKYSNPKSENFYFLLLKMISEFTFTNSRGEKKNYHFSIIEGYEIRKHVHNNRGVIRRHNEFITPSKKLISKVNI